MTDFNILAGDKPILVVTADKIDGAVTEVSKVEGADWQFDLAKGLKADDDKFGQTMTPLQYARYFGRDASVNPVDGEVDGDLMPVVKTESDTDVRFASGDIVKADEDERVVFGWAYVTHDKDGQVNVDKSGDFIDEVTEIEKSAYDFVLNSRNSDADHTNVKGGTLVESVVFTPEKIAKMGIPEGAVPLGWWVGFKIEDEATWSRVKKGELRAFSVHGKGTRKAVDS